MKHMSTCAEVLILPVDSAVAGMVCVSGGAALPDLMSLNLTSTDSKADTRDLATLNPICDPKSDPRDSAELDSALGEANTDA